MLFCIFSLCSTPIKVDVPASRVYVYLGRPNLKRSTGQIRIGVEKVVVHPEYNGKRHYILLFYDEADNSNIRSSCMLISIMGSSMIAIVLYLYSCGIIHVYTNVDDLNTGTLTSGDTPHDIALIKINKVQVNDAVAPIYVNKRYVFQPGYTCSVTGWGEIKQNTSMYMGLYI